MFLKTQNLSSSMFFITQFLFLQKKIVQEILGRAAWRVKVLQLELEGSRFKSH